MKIFKHSFRIILIFILFLNYSQSQELYFPVRLKNRQSADEIKLTEIGQFGLWRIKWKANSPHFHTGMDIKRPVQNYKDEPVFPIAYGGVISVRSDGPNSQIIIEHQLNDLMPFWSVYEHIMAIMVKPGEIVDPFKQIARFITAQELNRFGWQFNHVHLEIMKTPPLKLKPSKSQPYWIFQTYTLNCFTEEKLYKYYYNPLEFIISNSSTLRTY